MKHIIKRSAVLAGVLALALGFGISAISTASASRPADGAVLTQDSNTRGAYDTLRTSLFGHLRDAGNHGIPHALVTLYWEQLGAHNWRASVQTRTNSAGDYSISFTPSGGARLYQVRYNGSSAASKVIEIRSILTPTNPNFSVSSTSITSGQTVSVYGAARDAAGESLGNVWITLATSTGGSFRHVASVRTDLAGLYSWTSGPLNSAVKIEAIVSQTALRASSTSIADVDVSKPVVTPPPVTVPPVTPPVTVPPVTPPVTVPPVTVPPVTVPPVTPPVTVPPVTPPVTVPPVTVPPVTVPFWVQNPALAASELVAVNAYRTGKGLPALIDYATVDPAYQTSYNCYLQNTVANPTYASMLSPRPACDGGLLTFNATNAQDALGSLIASPAHEAEMVNPSFTYIECYAWLMSDFSTGIMGCTVA